MLFMNSLAGVIQTTTGTLLTCMLLKPRSCKPSSKVASMSRCITCSRRQHQGRMQASSARTSKGHRSQAALLTCQLLMAVCVVRSSLGMPSSQLTK